MRKKIVIAVGGTGGHVLPARKIGKMLSDRFDIIYVGVGLSKNPFFEKEGAIFFDVEGSGRAQGLIKCGIKNIQGILQARKILKKIGAEKILGFGSYHSFPVLAAGAYLEIPYHLFEFNVVPGRVNRLFSRGAEKVFIHFEPKKKKIQGNLISIDFAFEKKTVISQEEARAYFGLDLQKKTILVFGGSQGAEPINQLIEKLMPELGEEFQFLHFKGIPFCHRMDLAWIAADFAICRAGAGAMREILMYEKPALLIPYPNAADDHQTYNAKYMEDIVKGAAFLKQQDLHESVVMTAILKLDEEKELMKEAIRAFKEQNKRPDLEIHYL